MKINFGTKVIGLGILVLGLVSSAFAANRVGPVSAYGQLQAGKNSSGKGQIYGACKGVSNGNEVVVQGMSLFWSISSDVGAPFWTADHVSKLVKEQNIQLIRAPMGVDEDWYSGNYFTNESYYQGLMNTVVQAAIDNDIYVIIDYHSHKASDDVAKAKTFFGYMAQKWGKYDNVIFEIFNEPTSQSWGTIKTYADDVVKTIREYSDNLIVVGNRSWDQYPNEAASNPVTDSKNNTAYTFHYYAGSHYTTQEGANAVSAMNSGLSVFVTEWGTVDASGNGNFNSSNSTTWYNWMKTHKLSGANWSVSNKVEDASYYTGSADNPSYSTSGQWVNSNVFASLPKSYTACDGGSPSSSSSIASSSSSMPAGYTDYIDDLEDGDNYTFTGGEWYAYTDDGDLGASTITNGEGARGGYNVVITGSKAGNSTKYVAGITGIKLSQGDNLYDPYVALGLALNEKQTAYDLSACTQISYKYKGAAHNFKAEDTAVLDYGYHQIHKSASNTWTTVTIPWDMLAQEAWPDPVSLSKKRIAKLTWEVKGDQPSQNYLYVDDVRCSGWAIQPVPSPASSSSSAKSSSSVASSSSAKSSSSVASSSSARSSSSVASSSSAKSSSSVASSSSAKSSSSVASSSSSNSENTDVSVEGSLNQIVAQGDEFETIRFKNVQTYSRASWTIYFLDFVQTGNVVTVSGTVPGYLQPDGFSETLMINGQPYEIKLSVMAAESSSSTVSSSSQEGVSSSSESDPSTSSSEAMITMAQRVSPISLTVENRMLHIGGVEQVQVNVFDMQGSPVASFGQVRGSVSLENLRQGHYIVRVRSGSNNLVRHISIR